MPLFEYNPEGFTLHSGGKSKRRINCDVDGLSNDDLRSLAAGYADNNHGKYRWIIPVMRGGLRFASILAPLVYAPTDNRRVLIVDDVWTTGGSIRETVDILKATDYSAVVIFARGPTPPWVTVASDSWMKGP